jgi:hypothetical protein
MPADHLDLAGHVDHRELVDLVTPLPGSSNTHRVAVAQRLQTRHAPAQPPAQRAIDGHAAEQPVHRCAAGMPTYQD